MSKDYQLSERQKKVVYAVVDSYINSPEPISSAQIAEKYMPAVSSATIRNELADLEDMGYLIKPHISAGRIPSSKAYRLYVESLNIADEMTALDIIDMEGYFEVKLSELDSVVRDVAKIISDETNYTSIVLLHKHSELLIKEIKLVPLSNNKALIVVVTDIGVVSDKIIDLSPNMTDNYIMAAERLLNETFVGKGVGRVEEIDLLLEERLQQFKTVFDQVVNMISKMRQNGEIIIEGKSKIFDYPEFADVQNVKNFLSIMESNDKLQKIVESGEDFEFSVKVGKDDDLENMAVVTAKYTIDGQEVGRASVIGPERMNYKKVLKVLKSLVKGTRHIKRP